MRLQSPQRGALSFHVGLGECRVVFVSWFTQNTVRIGGPVWGVRITRHVASRFGAPCLWKSPGWEIGVEL